MNTQDRARLAQLVGETAADELLGLANRAEQALEATGVAFKGVGAPPSPVPVAPTTSAGISTKQRQFLERLLGPEMAAAVCAGLELQDAATREGAQAAGMTPEGLAVLARLKASSSPAAAYVADLVKSQAPPPQAAQPRGAARRTMEATASAYVNDLLSGKVLHS